MESDSRPPRPSLSDADRRKFSTTFDALVDSNLHLTEACGKLTGSVSRLVTTLYVALTVMGVVTTGAAAAATWVLLHH